MTTIKRITDYVGAEYKKVGDIRSTIENEQRYNIPSPIALDKTTTITVNNFYTMEFKMEVDVYVKCKFVLEDNIKKAYYLVLGKCTKLIKIKLNQIKGWSKVSTKFDVLNLINIIKYILLKFEN